MSKPTGRMGIGVIYSEITKAYWYYPRWKSKVAQGKGLSKEDGRLTRDGTF
jgi:hypothetical protein